MGGRALQLQSPCLAPEAPDQPGTIDVLWATRGAAGRRGHESDHKERQSRPIIAAYSKRQLSEQITAFGLGCFGSRARISLPILATT